MCMPLCQSLPGLGEGSRGVVGAGAGETEEGWTSPPTSFKEKQLR